MRKGNEMSKEEKALLDLLSLLIETFERKHYKIKKSTPRAILNELMAANRLKPQRPAARLRLEGQGIGSSERQT